MAGALGARCINDKYVFGVGGVVCVSFKQPLNNKDKKDSAPKAKKTFFLTCTVFIFSLKYNYGV